MSGNLLNATCGSMAPARVVDPVTGCQLAYSAGIIAVHAWPTLLPGGHNARHGCAGRLQPVHSRMRNDLVRSRHFYVSSELDCFIQTLRRTRGVNTQVTNEK